MKRDLRKLLDTARALWLEGREKVAIAAALLKVAEEMTGASCADAAFMILAPVAGRAEATEAVKSALLERYRD